MTEKPVADKSWFTDVEPVTCRVFWTESNDNDYWTGTLDRVVDFNETTRTISVAIRVSAEEALSGTASLPLVAGMFCRVEIPGTIMNQVCRLPRWSVTFENQVYVVEDGRLMPRDVNVLRTQNNQSFIKSGLDDGELVITTRLLNPLPNSKVEYLEELVKASTDLGDNAGEGNV